MSIDLQPYFDQYEKLAKTADEIFNRIKKEFPECVACEQQCDDCCHALFDLTLIEALYINHQFNLKFEGKDKEKRIELANRADRKVYKMKREAYKAYESGKDEVEILTEMAKKRVRCPLLNDQKMCELYAYRPITCRLYGIPTDIGGKAHTCGISRFSQGKQYPTVSIDKIQQKLYALSDALVKDIKSKHLKLSELLVPLSMALLTEYDDTYLGLSDSAGMAGETQKKAGKNG